ncbi:DmsC/YnfH family molybdoenzyme membrane anchor subunit [Rhodoferax sp.]|uniref:dimethyl sulfoxide reductase anchor subunit family protein n=1 Tax=Rhodoferax sp. TaxID=50421 RepID=UPI002624B4AD|nr:DmsC/YnfH family molybdoenzyme membrane anchor subunit [Rhodoferax sp.]MDD2809649.1 dimethyl sulfoxide reductase anchor subunit [Rhodoferax sp.]
MQPAYSVIFLTTLIGAAQGLFLTLYATELGVFGATSVAELRPFVAYSTLVALFFTGLGLLASFFHLGHPERAWRAATMWRTSWLSREVIALPMFMGGLCVYGAAHWMGWGVTSWVGGITTVLCLGLFVATAMIYASVKFLQEWASPLTVVNYILLGCASGLTLATLLAALLGVSELVTPYAMAAAVMTGLAWVSRSASLLRNARIRPKSNLQSAIGIKHPRIVQKAQGFMGGSFNTREFFHGRTAQMLRSVKWAFLLMVFPLPLLGLALGVNTVSSAVLFLVFAIQYAGLLAERWFFFAQANHPQNLYYQTIS